MPQGLTCAANAFLFPAGTERTGGHDGEDRKTTTTTTVMRIQVAYTHSYVRLSVSPFLLPFDPIPRFSTSLSLQSLYFASYARFLRPTTSPRSLLLLLLFSFFYCCRRFVLFSFCLFPRLRTGSLHSRAPRVEGPRQGKPVSRVRVISPCRHARSSMTFRARTPRECNTNDAPARSSILDSLHRSF